MVGEVFAGHQIGERVRRFAVERAGMATLEKDQRVKYELETDRRGKTSAAQLEAA